VGAAHPPLRERRRIGDRGTTAQRPVLLFDAGELGRKPPAADLDERTAFSEARLVEAGLARLGLGDGHAILPAAVPALEADDGTRTHDLLHGKQTL
jgi:hypothetical protein